MSFLSLTTLTGLLEARAAKGGSEPFLEVDGTNRTTGELLAAANAIAGGIQAQGLAPGDRIAVIADNCVDVVELWFGALQAGAILAPINTALRGQQLEHVLQDASPAAVVVQPRHAGRLEDILALRGTKIWTTGQESVGLTTDVVAVPIPRDGNLHRPTNGQHIDDVAALLYTSGTTGPSKGVTCPHSQLYWWGHNTASILGISGEDVLYTCLPLFHVNALNTLVQGLVSGARVVVGPHFSASRFWLRMAEADATVTYLLGAMVSILAGREPSPHDRDHRLRVILAPATPAPLWEPFEQRFGVRLVEGHGMTETNFAIGPLEGKQRPGWMGRVMPGFSARVVDENGTQVPPGVPGELLLKPEDRSSFASGYSQAEHIDEMWVDGWFRTGDRVVYDEEGFYRFVDRVKDAIRRRGENISAWEVEQALDSHPNVIASAVVPTPSELGEDEVRAFLVIKDPTSFDPEQLIRHCEPRLAYFAIPRYLDVIGELPLTENGKVRKHLLRSAARTPDTWDREKAGIELRR